MWYDRLSPSKRLQLSPKGRQSIISHSYKVDNCFITSNILHSAIILSSLFPRLPGEQTFHSSPCCCCVPREVTGFRNTWGSQGNFHGGFSHAVDITMRPNVQRLIERNFKCHVTFFRLIQFKISIWVCYQKIYICIDNTRYAIFRLFKDLLMTNHQVTNQSLEHIQK